MYIMEILPLCSIGGSFGSRRLKADADDDSGSSYASQKCLECKRQC